MKLKINPVNLCGKINAPPSKSMAHRLLICAALAKGKSIIHGISDSGDMAATLGCLSALGVEWSKQGDTVTVYGADISEFRENSILPCKESASTLRFFIPLCLMNGKKMRLEGTEALLSRPMTVYESICREQNLVFEKETATNYLVKGRLTSGEYKVAGNISSQFISGLLFALPLLKGDSKITIIPPIESEPYLHLTIQALALFGIKAEFSDERTLSVKGGQKYLPRELSVEGDYSNSSFFAALNLFDGNDIEINGLCAESLQGDRVYEGFFEKLNSGMPMIHIGNCPDLGPVLMAVAAAKNGAVLCGTHRLRIKESNRGEAMAHELEKFGTVVTVKEDSIIIYPASFHKPDEVLDGHNDHRIVMALTTLLLICGGTIDGAQAVSKSLPNYFDLLRELGADITDVTEK